MTNMKAVHFGAGNIGRGFIGYLLYQSHYDITFVYIFDRVVDDINKYKRYTVTTLSTSPNKEKVENTAKKIEVPYIFFAKKPCIKGLNKAKKIMNLTNEAIAVVGDQIFTDVIGANRAKMFPILVKPINEKDIWITKFKRPIENKIIQRYLKKNKGEKNVHQ